MTINKNHLLIIFVILGIAIFSLFYISAISPYWKITPDSTTYVNGAKSIAVGKGYTTRGKAASLYPPMASLIFSPFVFFFPENYFALNLLVTIFLFLSMILVFILFQKEIGGWKSLAIVLLSLGSIYLFYESTRLLSDIFFMFFSIAAITFIKRSLNSGSAIVKYIFAAIFLSVACMIRLVGIDLALAIMIYAGICLPRNNKKRDHWILILGAFISIVFIVLWEYRNMRIGYSYIGKFFSEQSGVVGLNGIADMARDFIFGLGRKAVSITKLLTNGLTGKRLLFFYPLNIVFLLLLFFGLAISLKRKLTIINIYTCIYLGHFFLLSPNRIRYLLAVLPFLFYFLFIAIEWLIKKSRALEIPFATKLLYCLVIIYISGYLSYSGANMPKAVAWEHTSPFGEDTIKYEWNYDLQKLANWIRDNLPQEDTYMCMHPNVVDMITKRRGYYFPFTFNKAKILEYIDRKQINYVLVNKRKPVVQEFLIPVIKTYPERFELVRDEKNASLYKVKNR